MVDVVEIDSRGVIALAAAALFVVCAGGYILAAGRAARGLTWLTKPFAMPLLALAYALASRSPNLWILAGLGCGAVGDLLLIRPERQHLFLAGLAAFLAGHLAYLAAFLGPVLRGGVVSPWVIAAAPPLAAIGILTYRALRPKLGAMKVPVALYTAVILAMGFAALLRVFSFPGLLSWLLLPGALCFIVSDMLLAYQQFWKHLPSGEALVALSYVAAQSLIALSHLLAEGPRIL